MDTENYTGQWYMSASDRERDIFKNWIRSHLVMGEMKIKFIKKDDTVRDMRCTLGAGYLPVTEEKEIKRHVGVLKEAELINQQKQLHQMQRLVQILHELLFS